MVKLLYLLSLASMGSALHIRFRRFADGQCNEAHHIRKDVKLEPNHCKQFDTDEPAFHSFKWEITKDPLFLNDARNQCYLAAWDSHKCNKGGESEIIPGTTKAPPPQDKMHTPY